MKLMADLVYRRIDLRTPLLWKIKIEEIPTQQ